MIKRIENKLFFFLNVLMIKVFNDFFEILNIFNNYFFLVGKNLVLCVFCLFCFFIEYLFFNYNLSFFFFDLVMLEEIECEIFLIFKNKIYGFYFCLICILIDVRCVILGFFFIIINIFV